MGWAKAIKAILISLPKILSGAEKLGDVLKKAAKEGRRRRYEKWIADGKEIQRAYEKAKDKNEKRKLLEKMHKHDSRKPKRP